MTTFTPEAADANAAAAATAFSPSQHQAIEQRRRCPARAPSPSVRRPTATKFRSSRKDATQWSQIREEFTRLYKEEGCPLREVVRHFEERGFAATENQFKNKIRQWKIEKNTKTNEMQHIIKIQVRRQRDDPHKRTKTRVRGRVVDEAKIERYKREHTAISVPKSRTPSFISCYTPTVTPCLPPESQAGEFLIWTPNLSTNGEHAIVNPSKIVVSPPTATGFSTPTPSNCGRRTNVESLLHPPSFEPQLDPKVSSSEAQEHLLQLFGQYILPQTSNDDHLYHEDRLHEYGIMEAEAQAQGLFAREDTILCGRDEVIRRIWRLTQILLFGKDQTTRLSLELSYTPDQRWLLSAIARLMVYERLPDLYEAYDLAAKCQKQAFHSGVKLYFHAGVAAYNSIKDKDVWERHDALHLVGCAILCGELSQAEDFLCSVMQTDANSLLESGALDEVPTQSPTGTEGHLALLHRRAVSQMHIIRWYRSHHDPKSLARTTQASAFFTVCRGVQLGNVHLCLSGECPASLTSPTRGEDFNSYEDDWVDPQFEVAEDFRLRVWQGLWRCLREYGHHLL